MIEPESIKQLSSEIAACVQRDAHILDELRKKVRKLKKNTRRIHSRVATAISLVGTDGGSNRIHFDPFMIQLVRVVDSAQNERCMEVITPEIDFDHLNARHLNSDGSGKTPLGRMMECLGVDALESLSPVFKADPAKRALSWVQVYREMTEWAVLLALVREETFANDTILLRDGFLRSKMFASLFQSYRKALEEAIELQYRKSKRRVFVVGIAKTSKVIQTYRLAMALEGVMRTTYPCYAKVDADVEKSVYKWDEYSTGGGEGEGFVAGQMFLAKFGSSPHDPVWAVDLLLSQVDEAQTVFGHVLADAEEGFPIVHYPLCLQRAHESAQLVDFDVDILQDQMSHALRHQLGEKKWVVDALALQVSDPGDVRYA